MSAEPATSSTTAKMGRSKAVTAQGAETRERILGAAKQLIAERGYAGASIGAICTRAAVVRTALYWHFGSKAGLLAAVAEEVFESWDAKIRGGVLTTPDPLQRLDRLIDGLRDMVLNEPAAAQLMFGVALEGDSIPSEVGESIRRQREAVHGMIIADFEDSVGSLPDLDVVARLIVALHHDAALMHRLDPGGPDVERIFDEMRRAIVLIVGHRLNEKLRAPEGESP